MTLKTVLTRLAADSDLRALLRWCIVCLLCALVAMASLPGPALAADAAGDGAAAPAAGARSGAVGAPNRLHVGTLVEFDPRSGNVGDAIKSLLEPVHYRITFRTVDPLQSASVLRRPIPPIAAHAGEMSIEAALLLLIGEDNRLVVDHAHRLVAVERLPADAGSPSP